MKVILILLGFILAEPVLAAAPMCTYVFGVENSSPRQAKLQELETQLTRHFKAEWFKDRSLTDAYAAKQLLKKIAVYGTDLDLDVLKVYLQILESTKGYYNVRTPGFYIDMYMGQRPKSGHFQDRHWDWNILEGYFFNSPSLMTFTKELDLNYLKHILKTAEQQAEPKTLRQVLIQANFTWALEPLQQHPALRAEYLNFVQSKNYATLYAELVAKVSQIRSETNNEAMQAALDAFRSGNSTFDLFVFNKYLDATLQFPVSEWKAPQWLQLTDWRIFEMGLPTGSIEHVTDFLFQNSHDVTTKIYLAEILNELRRPGLKKESDFYFSFLKARESLDQKITPVPAPSLYQTDMKIFSISHEPTERMPGNLNEVRVFWNKTLGRLQANVERFTPVNPQQEATVGMNPQLRAYVKKYFDGFRQEHTYSEEEIQHFESKEFNSPLLQTTYIAFTRPESDQMLAMIRIFDATKTKTFIERDFNLNFEERKNQESIYELGRLLATPEVEAKSFPYIMARVAEYFQNINASGMTYGDGNRSASAYYQRFGYKMVYTPEQLGITGDATPMWVFRQSVPDLIQRFYKPFETVKLRPTENTSN